MAPTYGLMSRPPVMCPRAAERAKRVKYDLMAVTVVYIEDGQRVAFHGHVLSDATGNPPQGKFGLCVRLGRSRPTWIAGAGARPATVPASVHQPPTGAVLPLTVPGQPCEICGWQSIASWRVPRACPLCGIRLCESCHKLHDCT